MAIERHHIESRAQWLELRKGDVTASRVGALFGQHPYVSALRLYLEHSGVDFPDPDNSVMRRGRWFESAVGVAVAEDRPDWKIVKADHYLRDPDLRLGATPDFYVDDAGRVGVLQTKTAAPSVYERDWMGGKEVPNWITLQTLTECMLADAAFGVVAVLLVDAFNPTVSIIDVPRHEGAEARIKLAVAKFWDDVREGREPAPDYGKDADIIRVLAPHEAAADATVDLSGDNELPTLLAERARKKALISELDERCKEIETEVKFKMRDAAVVAGVSDWKITWKTQHQDSFVMPARDTRVLRILDKRKEFA